MSHWTFPDIPVNDLAKEVVEESVVAGRPQTKEQLLELVLAKHHVRAQVRVIGGTFPGWQWDRAIESHIWAVLTEQLHRKDENGVRLYQCWPAGGGQWFWEPFSAFDLPKLQTLKRSAQSRRRQAEMSEQRIELWIEEVEKRGGTVADVYTAVVAKWEKSA